MRKGTLWAAALLALPASLSAQKQKMPPVPPPIGPAVPPPSTQSAPMRISLDEAIRLALQHNHALLAARSTILQNQAQEVTANLRPNPVLLWDTQFLPIFQPQNFTADYFSNSAQFDIGVSYLFERGKKRQHRLQAAKDQTAVTRAQVTDNERTLTFNVAQQFVGVLLAQSTIDLAKQDLDSFQKTVDVSQERFKAGDMSEGDLLKIQLQLLQFQSDVLNANLSKVQALDALRQLLGFESVGDNFDVEGQLDYQPVRTSLDDLKLLALRTRPDLQATHFGVNAARSQESLAEANGKRDLNVTFDYSHVGGVNSGTFFFNIDLPIFDRNQGEIARTRYAITQSQELQNEAAEQVISDVVNAYEGLRANDQIVQLYRSGYVEQSQKSRDISEYAYKRGAASLLDFLDAERTYRTNQLAYRQALASYMTALEQMREAVGTRNLP
ncbi:MAG TPA: TolC family protein [Candidatus Methylomirabilis sp.]|nr:TolC family protein [Candidatus Methylomirabilis sp.]